MDTAPLLCPGAPGYSDPATLAGLATDALVAEALLTPKPGLVDRTGRGAHDDMDLTLLFRSAAALRPTFAELAAAASDSPVGPALRAEVGRIGRAGEAAMLEVTGGVNTHRGALFTLGLLLVAVAATPGGSGPLAIGEVAGRLARIDDPAQTPVQSHGALVARRYGAPGVRAEAARGFPHVTRVALPLLRARRASEGDEIGALDALLAVMARLEDTCLLYRGGRTGLAAARRGAARVLALGGSATPLGWSALVALDTDLSRRHLSPGGSADVLAAALFLDAAAARP